MNSKQKGDLALSKAISYYMEAGFEVLLPIGDKRPYDLVVENAEGILRKVQCKFTSHKRKSGKYAVPLRVMGGNRSYNTAKKYDKKDFDILFVFTDNGAKYAIPFSEVEATNSLTLNSKYDIFLING
jgi:hypothetical protein